MARPVLVQWGTNEVQSFGLNAAAGTLGPSGLDPTMSTGHTLTRIYLTWRAVSTSGDWLANTGNPHAFCLTWSEGSDAGTPVFPLELTDFSDVLWFERWYPVALLEGSATTGAGPTAHGGTVEVRAQRKVESALHGTVWAAWQWAGSVQYAVEYGWTVVHYGVPTS